jgi:hypothetical protein
MRVQLKRKESCKFSCEQTSPARARRRTEKCFTLRLCAVAGEKSNNCRYGRVGAAVVPVWDKPRLTIIFTSTRRFCVRPSRVVLSATASVFP